MIINPNTNSVAHTFSWTVPKGVSETIVTLIGAGGGGGSSNATPAGSTSCLANEFLTPRGADSEEDFCRSKTNQQRVTSDAKLLERGEQCIGTSCC